MKVIVRTRAALLRDFELAMGMHRLRGRVFKERLDWDVSVTGGKSISTTHSSRPISWRSSRATLSVAFACCPP
ncbi:N-acyl-L-homoserine lactone synthetase [Bradyrhizobium sp. LB8.2]